MADQNSLGAPTEGLGQRVTFAFNAPSRGTGLQLADPGNINAGVRGGGTVAPGATTTTSVDVKESATMALLGKIGDSVLAGQMEKQRTANFVAGMQRAMQGEAVADIARDQPWYSKLFGDSDVLEGARAYTGYTASQAQVAAMEDNMPELRKMPPQEAQQFFIDSVQNNLTGDKATDLTILQNMTRAMPSVMRRQAKEHYAFRQEEATIAESTAFRSGAQRLQSAASGLANGITTKEEFDGITDSFMAALIPPKGRDIENYKQSLTANLTKWAQDGSLHALNAVKNRGLLDALDPQQRVAVDRAVEAGEGKLRTHYSFQWNDELSELRAQSTLPTEGQTADDIRKRIDGLNARYQAETGSDRGIIEPEQRAAMLSGSAVAIRRAILEQDSKKLASTSEARTAADKATAAETKSSVISARVADGTVATLVAGKAVTDADVSEVVLPQYLQMSPQDQVKLLTTQREDYTFGAIRDIRIGQIEKALLAEQYTPEVQAAFDQYAQLRQANRFVADKYYGRFASALEGFHNDVAAGMSPAGSFRDRFVGDKRTPLDKAEMKIALETVTSEYNSFLPEWMGGQKLRPGTARRVVNVLANDAERMASSTGNVKEAVVRAFNQRKAQGLELIGGFAWENAKGQQPLSEYLTTNIGGEGEAPVATDNVNKAFGYAVDELLYGSEEGAGILPDSASDTVVIRLPDQGGVPIFHVQSVVDGKVYNGKLSARDIYSLSAKRQARMDQHPILGKRVGKRSIAEEQKNLQQLRESEPQSSNNPLSEGILGKYFK